MPSTLNELLDNKDSKIVCIGAHPDDPEGGCGGTIAKLSQNGNQVTIIYLTRGEAGIKDQSSIEAAATRTKEAETANNILGAKPIFAGQIDGEMLVDNASIKILTELIQRENPSIVFTHWPIDINTDHQVTSLLTVQAWINLGQTFALYFYEVCNGKKSQTMVFKPTDYVDISEVLEKKHQALLSHASQAPEGIYKITLKIMGERGSKIGVEYAEAFMRMESN